jgi:type 1 glutamine amidotransferase
MRMRFKNGCASLSGMWLGLLVLVVLLVAAEPAAAARDRLLVFTKAADFEHDSRAAGVEAIRSLGARNGFVVEATEDTAAFGHLERYAAVIFLSTTGDVLGATEQAALRRYVRGGGGFVGVHSAADTEHGWPWYGTLLGARFVSHPPIQTATVRVVDRSHPSTQRLPALWERTDEWYDFAASPRDDVRVLATVDETTYTGGKMGADHPIAWCHAVGRGRSWYTAGGHTSESYAEPLFRSHLLGGIRWAARRR